jgi:ABC-2 type transport system ATP-binding protein
MLHEPELLLLDEPASGLDPAGIVQVREMLRTLACEKGTTVLMSSHLLDEVARLASRIGIIHQGHLLEELDAARLEQRLRPRLYVDARDRGAARLALMDKGFSVNTAGDGTLEIDSDRAIEHPDDIASLLVAAGAPPTLLKVKQESLEAHFLRMVGQAEASLHE